MKKSTRQAYGEALVELGRSNKNIVVLDADLT
ncbi:MAG: transketolase family protein, partial [Cetobacterium sp.]